MHVSNFNTNKETRGKSSNQGTMSNIMRGGKIDSILNGVALGSLPVYAYRYPFMIV